jgi:hypothetical protein
MAINIGDMLGGIGAAFGGTAQQYAQGIRQREQQMTQRKREELQARQIAMYQDAGAAYQLLQQRDFDGIINLANDRLEILQTFDDADPSDTMRILENAMAAKAGDPIALRNLTLELTGAASAGRAMGILQAPEVRQPKGVVVNGNLVDEQTGDILYQSPAEAPNALTDIGKLRADLEAGRITQTDFDAEMSNMQQGRAPAPVRAATNIGQLNQDMQAGLITPSQYEDEINRAASARELQEFETQTTMGEQQERQSMQQMELQRIYDLTERLASNQAGLAGATGPVSSRLPSFREATVDFEANLKELQDLLTMTNLGRMTGVLSQSDIALIANAASGISERGSEARMNEKLIEIRARVADKLGLPAEIVAPQQPQQPIEDKIAEANRIVNRTRR